MKKLSILIAAVLINTYSLFAQAPNKMSYQAVIRNAQSELVISKPVKMRISILQGSTTGTSVYSELHNPTTNANGLATIEIGGGTSPQGTFSSINWGNGTYFIKTETDPANGTSYSIVGTSQLLSVPYAFQANNAGNGFKRVSATGDTLFWENGKSVIIPGTSNANNAAAPGTVTDASGNTYPTVTIGTQVWMAENLRTTKYRDGSNIPVVTDDTQWAYNWNNGNPLQQPMMCWYNNDQATYTANKFGALYNWYAINPATNGNKNVCPIGWHVPTDAEWTRLTDFLGGVSVAGGKMKSAGTQYWISPNTGATNSSSFSGLPGGMRISSSPFSSIGDYGLWWSSTEKSYRLALYCSLSYKAGGVGVEGVTEKESGISVRCVRD